MSNGDDEAAEDEPAEQGEEPATEDEPAEQGEEPAGTDLDPESLEARLDETAQALEAAETESDLDDVAATLEDIETDLEAADLPESEDDEGGDEESAGERLEGRLADLRDDLESQRGPYIEDVAETVAEAAATLRETRWTDDGEAEAAAAARSFGEAAAETLEGSAPIEAADATGAADALEDLADRLEATDLDPDHDREAIATLLAAAEELTESVDAAEAWEDLTVREQLAAQGFYDVLDSESRKDFPAEWNAIKIYEQGREPEPILNALDRFESDFMEENILDALEHFAPVEAFEAMHERAQKRDRQPIRILGRIGDDRACETLHEFLGGGDVKLEKVTLRALGAIGSEDSTQPVADRLVADNPEVRSLAARALGLIGDTRAIRPLKRVLEEDDADEVRASAAWALNRIGTERALSVAAEYADDRSYIVQVEAEKAAGV